MFKNFNIKIPSCAETINKAKEIYNFQDNFLKASSLSLKDNEAFINFLDGYDSNKMEQFKELLYILFYSKKVKGEFINKKTLCTIKNFSYSAVFTNIEVFSHFIINNLCYPINPVRNVLLCDVLYACGGIFEANELHSAIFLPYFIDNPNDDEKYTIVFVNLMFERFKQLACNIFKALDFEIFFNSQKIEPLKVKKEDIATWILLHEYIHNSGPLPLLSYSVDKFSKKQYGFIEEMRVDLTTVKIILENLVQQTEKRDDLLKVILIIILERLFRAAFYNYSGTVQKNGMFSKEVEGDVAIALMVLLYKKGMLDLKNHKININTESLLDHVNFVLSDIYEYEQKAKEKQLFDNTYKNFINYFRNKHLLMNDDVHRFLCKYYVQDCNYSISFMI